jgi:proteasome lid subunit RPN8/RPN11
MISLPPDAFEAIRAHGRETYPEECCGALLGTLEDGRTRVARIERMANARENERRRRYTIDPLEYLRVEKRADAQGLALIGFYHSHPDHPAAPSEYDREHALTFFHYLVLAVASGEPGELTAWVLSEDRGTLENEPLTVEDSGD